MLNVRVSLSMALCLSVSTLTAQARPAAPDRSQIRREVESRTRGMIQAFERGDLRAVARFYADDARIYASGTAVEGRAEIDRFWLKIRHPSSWVMETVDVGGSRDEPYQLVRSILVQKAGVHADTSLAMCLLVWRREADGLLRVRLDVFAVLPEAKIGLSELRRRYGIRPREN